MVSEPRFPVINGFSVRRYRDASDFEAMSRVSQKSWLADGFEFMKSKEELAAPYEELEMRDPATDLVFIESGAEVVGYGESYSEPVDQDTTSFWNFVHLLPEWRGRGIREEMLGYNERRLLELADALQTDGYYQTWACGEPNDWKDLILRNGYKPSWNVFEMIRPNPDDVPDFELPPGLEVRPVPPERYRDVWEGMREAYRMEPWYSDALYDSGHFKAWQKSQQFEPELWQVAWDGDRIVGAVQNYIQKDANRAFGKRVGNTEGIFVASDWRRKGVAKALISRSMKMLARLGMTEASLDVNVTNASGALHLYEALGFRPIHSFVFCRKPLSS